MPRLIGNVHKYVHMYICMYGDIYRDLYTIVMMMIIPITTLAIIYQRKVGLVYPDYKVAKSHEPPSIRYQDLSISFLGQYPYPWRVRGFRVQG